MYFKIRLILLENSLSFFILFAFGRAFFLRLNLINERAIGGIFEAIDDGEMNETTDG
jgi:hypothetical protein